MSTSRLFANSLHLRGGLLNGYRIELIAQTAKQTEELKAEIIRCLPVLLAGEKVEALKTNFGKHKITFTDGVMSMLENGNIEDFVENAAIAIKDESMAAKKSSMGYHNWRSKYSKTPTALENEATTSESDGTSSDDENMLKGEAHETPRRTLGFAN